MSMQVIKILRKAREQFIKSQGRVNPGWGCTGQSGEEGGGQEGACFGGSVLNLSYGCMGTH